MAGFTKVFGYLRVSGKGQLDGDGFTRQRAAIQAYADAHSIRIVKWFEEQGVSGKTDMVDRPAFQAMLSEILSNGCRTVLVESLDRLAREYRVQEHLLIYMASRGIALIPANTGENVTEALMGDPMRRPLVQIQGIFAELDKNLLVAKLRKARQRTRQREGRCEGRKPFGEREGELEVIERIQKLAGKGMNYTEIADKLNADGLPTRANGTWYPATVSRILARAV
jgi:site-specific DNA recombinase